MHRTTLALFLLACSLTAHATEPQVKRTTTGFAGACQAANGDEGRIRRGALFGTNTSTAPARVHCSPDVDTSQNGAKRFGLTISNLHAVSARVITCTAEVSTVGPGRQLLITRSVIVNPRGHADIAWGSLELGEGKTFLGGQVGVTCTLPPATAVSNVWTQAVSN